MFDTSLGAQLQEPCQHHGWSRARATGRIPPAVAQFFAAAKGWLKHVETLIAVRKHNLHAFFLHPLIHPSVSILSTVETNKKQWDVYH